MTKAILFMFPYAGASASVFEKWKTHISADIHLVPLELPGRGKRFGEPLLASVDALVSSIYRELMPHIGGLPYALFGHSLGSILAYETGRKLKSLGYAEPVHLFVSGRSAPHIEENEGMHTLPDDTFVNKIYDLGGTPPHFFENPQLRALFLPILRADYKASETYTFDASRGKLACDFTVFSGMQDGDYDPAAWGVHTTGGCAQHAYEGGHFFLHEHAELLAERIQACLL